MPWFSHLYNGLKALSSCGVTPADRLTLGAGEGVGLLLGFGHEDRFQPVLGSPQERLWGPRAGLGAARHKLPVPHAGLLSVTTPAATEIKQAAIITTKYYLIIPSQSSTDLFLRGAALPPTTRSVSAETMATARTVPLHIRMHSHCHPHQHQQPAFISQRQKADVPVPPYSLYRISRTDGLQVPRGMGTSRAPRLLVPVPRGCVCWVLFARTIILMLNPAGKSKSKVFSSTNWGQKRPSLTRELKQV